LLVAMLAGGPTWPGASIAAEQTKPERENVRLAQKQFRSPNIADRLEAVKRLRDAPAQDAVKIVAPYGLGDPAEEVRRAAYDVLLTWRNDRQASQYLLKTLDKEIRAKQRNILLIAPLTAVLLASDLPETRKEIDSLLNDYVAASPDGAMAIIIVADELGKQGDRQALASLLKMTKLKCFDDTFACRRAIVQAIIPIRLPEAVEALIALLPKVDGEVRADIVRRLAAISGQAQLTDGKVWQKWWEKSRESLKFPASDAKTPFAADEAAAGPSYYGLAIHARRMVFVIDISGSMEGLRLAAAKRELAQAIDGLPENAAFGIVAFSTKALVWRPNLVPASQNAKQAAKSFVYTLRAGGVTAAYDALEAAFRFDAEAVYFLSDGQPNAGKIPAPAAIASAITQANRARRISVYAIGIAPGLPGSPLDVFLKTLAEQNFGVYRRVDQ
jgi:hypothetical protein